jgi:hypothetical protein
VMRLRIRANILLEQLARVADSREQKYAGNNPKKTEGRLDRLNLRNYDYICHVFPFSFRVLLENRSPMAITTGYA